MIKLTKTPILSNCQVPNGYFCVSFFKELRVNLKHKIQTLAYYVNTDVLLAIEKSLGVILQVDTQPAYDNDADEVPDE